MPALSVSPFLRLQAQAAVMRALTVPVGELLRTSTWAKRLSTSAAARFAEHDGVEPYEPVWTEPFSIVRKTGMSVLLDGEL